MRSSSLILLTALATSDAFAPNANNLSTRNTNVNNGLHMTVKVPITLTGDNIDLTPALQEYANEKLERTLGKLSSVSGVTHCDVHLTVNKNPKVRYMLTNHDQALHLFGRSLQHKRTLSSAKAMNDTQLTYVNFLNKSSG